MSHTVCRSSFVSTRVDDVSHICFMSVIEPQLVDNATWSYVITVGYLVVDHAMRMSCSGLIVVGLLVDSWRISTISEPGNALLELYLQSYRGFKEKFFKVSITDAGRRFFFDGEGNPRFPLYWTQDPLRFTSWSEDNMTIEELEALSMLTSLPRPFSSRQIIDCLEFDDAGARVFEIMGRKGSGRSWFQTIDDERDEGNRPGSSVGQQRPLVPPAGPPPVVVASAEETTLVEVPLMRKRKAKTVDISREASKKSKEVVEENERPLPLGIWDRAFMPGHRVDLNMDASEKKVIENMSEQQIADSLLEMNTRAQALAWHLAYASDRGQMRSELEKVRAQLKELAEIHAGCEVRQKRTEQLLKEGETLWNKTREAGVALQQERDQIARDLDQAKNSMLIVARERNALKVEVFEKNELIEELKDAIMDEHKKGFRKALRQVGHLLQVSTKGAEFDVRKDVHEGHLKPLKEIPDDAVLEGEEDEEEVANNEPEGATEVDELAKETAEAVEGDTSQIVID
ncbi:hypothetical protein LR48_Vigan10g237000 [Vigna angularis]|uniref:Uncharacterized protein n=1 Tax=Phaseolus angularis TaxID=3914 RepID=A0A0L9VNG2_PHAAN|nr:hypothetical protein LR48_Vigan10g237000 [Vigna angularis]